MSTLARYPVPRAIAPGAINNSRLSNLQLEATVPPTPVLEFMAPQRAPREAVETGAVGKPRLYFRLEPPVPVVLEFLRPLRAPREAVETGAVGDPWLYFRLEAAAVVADPARTINIIGESRAVIIVGASRAVTIIGELQTVTIPSESRAVTTVGESRTVTA